MFEKVSGKKLSYDADVEIGKEYYLLKRGYLYRKSCSNMQIQEIIQKRNRVELDLYDGSLHLHLTKMQPDSFLTSIAV